MKAHYQAQSKTAYREDNRQFNLLCDFCDEIPFYIPEIRTTADAQIAMKRIRLKRIASALKARYLDPAPTDKRAKGKSPMRLCDYVNALKTFM